MSDWPIALLLAMSLATIVTVPLWGDNPRDVLGSLKKKGSNARQR